MKRTFLTLGVLAVLGSAAFASTVTPVTGPQDPSQLNQTINTLINNGNANWSADGRNWLSTSTITANGTNEVSMTTVGPPGMTTSTIIEWMRVRNPQGLWRFIPLWGCGSPTC